MSDTDFDYLATGMPQQPQVVVPPRDYTPEEKAAQQAAIDQENEALRDAQRAARRAQLQAQLRSALGTLFELGGLAVAAYGLSLLALWLGVFLGGVGLIIIGVAIDPPAFPAVLARRNKAPESSAE